MNKTSTALVVFLLVAALSYLFRPSPERPGEKELVEIKNVVGDKKVMVDTTSMVTIYKLYQNLGNEVPLCLHGFSMDSSVTVTGVSLPNIKMSNSSAALFRHGKSCKSDDYVGMIHNHPNGGFTCAPSETDVLRYKLDQRAKVEMIACEWGNVVRFYTSTS